MAALTLRSALGLPMGWGIMRQCLETRTLDQLGERLDQLEDAKGASYGSTKYDQPTHVAH